MYSHAVYSLCIFPFNEGVTCNVCLLYEFRQKLYDVSATTVRYEDMVPILACNYLTLFGIETRN